MSNIRDREVLGCAGLLYILAIFWLMHSLVLRHKADAKVLHNNKCGRRSRQVGLLSWWENRFIYSLKVVQNSAHWSLPSLGLRHKAEGCLIKDCYRSGFVLSVQSFWERDSGPSSFFFSIHVFLIVVLYILVVLMLVRNAKVKIQWDSRSLHHDLL